MSLQDVIIVGTGPAGGVGGGDCGRTALCCYRRVADAEQLRVEMDVTVCAVQRHRGRAAGRLKS
jgi:thioredoxin reductase